MTKMVRTAEQPIWKGLRPIGQLVTVSIFKMGIAMTLFLQVEYLEEEFIFLTQEHDCIK